MSDPSAMTYVNDFVPFTTGRDDRRQYVNMKLVRSFGPKHTFYGSPRSPVKDPIKNPPGTTLIMSDGEKIDANEEPSHFLGRRAPGERK